MRDEDETRGQADTELGLFCAIIILLSSAPFLDLMF